MSFQIEFLTMVISIFRQFFSSQSAILLDLRLLSKTNRKWVIYCDSRVFYRSVLRATKSSCHHGKTILFAKKMWFKYDCMIRKYPPMLHKISEKVIRFIKSDHNVQKPMKMHRFSWKLRAFSWFSLSELYKGKSQQPTRLPGSVLVFLRSTCFV